MEIGSKKSRKNSLDARTSGFEILREWQDFKNTTRSLRNMARYYFTLEIKSEPHVYNEGKKSSFFGRDKQKKIWNDSRVAFFSLRGRGGERELERNEASEGEGFRHLTDRLRPLRTMDQEGCCARCPGGVVARHASIVAVMHGQRALYPQCEIELADLMRGGFPRLQRPAILQPGDLQRRVALADGAGHVHSRTRLDIVGKAKRIDFRWYCKLQEARVYFTPCIVIVVILVGVVIASSSGGIESRENRIVERAFLTHF